MINYTFKYFGPHLFQTKLDKEFCKEMLNYDGKNAASELVGYFDTENWITDEGQKYFMNYLENKGVFEAFKQSHKHFYNEESPDFTLDSLWINYMSPGDFNPIHNHDKDLSFVLFLNSPEEIKIENLEVRKKIKGKDAGPGCLVFLYGEKVEGFISQPAIIPETGELFIFPSRLRHVVYPFKSNVQRITIAGNFKFKRT